jgi:hypothetical protein
MFETALVKKSEDQLGTFGEITLDKKSRATVPLRLFNLWILLPGSKDTLKLEELAFL